MLQTIYGLIPSDKYVIRIEYNGQYQFQDSEMFALVGEGEEVYFQPTLFGGTSHDFYNFFFLCCVL